MNTNTQHTHIDIAREREIVLFFEIPHDIPGAVAPMHISRDRYIKAVSRLAAAGALN